MHLPVVVPRPVLTFVATLVALSACLASPLRAHGGQYRGPTMPPPSRVPGGPISPGGLPPNVPTTGGGTLPSSGFTSWAFWWEFNKDRYLRLKAVVRGAEEQPEPGTQTVPDGKAPTPADLDDDVLPALKRLLESTDNRDVATSVLIAMAKIGREHPDVDTVKECLRHLPRDNQEVRESAALALGIADLPGCLEPLIGVASDSRDGRRLVDRNSVDERQRAFAIYSLAFLGRRGDAERRQQVHDVLAAMLADHELDHRDVRIALIQGLSVLQPDATTAAGKRLLWQTITELDGFYDLDLGNGEHLVQAHVPPGLAKLVGRGDTPDHRRLRAKWIEELRGRERRTPVIAQSLVLALGEIALPPESGEGHMEVSAELRRYYQDGRDQQARHFCLIALGRIGGESNREWLLDAHRKARKATEKPWAALALGILAWESADRGQGIDKLIGETLIHGLGNVENDDYRSAAAVALGLTGFVPGEQAMRRLLARYESREDFAGYLCLGLAMLRSDGGREDIIRAMRNSKRLPRLMQQAATALALYGDGAAIDELIRVMQEPNSNLAKLAATSTAFRFVGDRTAIRPLIQQMLGRDTTTLTRAFAAAALGGVCDKDLMPWNEPFAANSNYLAHVPTLTDGMTGILDIL